MMSSHIPEELISEIFLRLPVKSLVRFRCLSKNFNSNIDCPNFINSRIKLSKKKGIHWLVYEQENSEETDTEHPEIHIIDINGGGFKTRVPTHPFPISWKPWGPNLLKAHCNGLVLLGQRFDDLVVWNPATGQLEKLPDCPMTISDNSSWFTAYGLGYDSSTDDYKVVLITEIKEEEENVTGRVEVWMLGLKWNSWRIIQDFSSLGYQVTQDTMNGNRFSDGELHFLLFHRDSNLHKLASFHLENETFNLIPVLDYKYEIRLQVLDDCLCMICSSAAEEDPVEVFLRKKYNKDEFTWTPLLSTTTKQFRTRLRRGKLLWFSESGNKIIIYYDDYLHSYDIIKDRLEPIWIGSFQHVKNSEFFICIDSLVPL